jgi:hypothetical protein
MKKNGLATLIAVFLFLSSNVIQAQDITPKLDQLKLMEDLWVGSFQNIIGNDSIEVSECQQYGNVFEYKTYLVVGGKNTFSSGGSYVFSSKEDKFIGFAWTEKGDYQTWIGLFTSEKKFCADFVQNFNPEKVLFKEVVEWGNPSSYKVTFFMINGTKLVEYKWTRRAK